MLYNPSRLAPVVLAVMAGLALVLAACGGDDEEDGNGGGNGGGPATFDVTMTDNAYEPNEFTVSAGAEVTFNLVNEGAAIHNMRVAGADNEFNNGDDAVSDPAIIPGGDSGTLTWTAPDEGGVIDIKCDYHPDDMTATITVE